MPFIIFVGILDQLSQNDKIPQVGKCVTMLNETFDSLSRWNLQSNRRPRRQTHLPTLSSGEPDERPRKSRDRVLPLQKWIPDEERKASGGLRHWLNRYWHNSA